MPCLCGKLRSQSSTVRCETSRANMLLTIFSFSWHRVGRLAATKEVHDSGG